MKLEDLIGILLKDNSSDCILENELEIFKLIPELRLCKGFEQYSNWHIYDVYNHILNVVDNVPPHIELRLAALFHDIGKPYTFSLDDNGQGHFYLHWAKSKQIFLNFAKKYNLDSAISNTISKLIYYHDLHLGNYDDEKLDEIINILTKQELKMLYQLKKADLLAQNPEYFYMLKDNVKDEKRLLLKYK